MKLLTKIIGPAPSEMSDDEVFALVRRNRVRIRKEIKEYRRLKNAIKAEQPKQKPGRPKKEVYKANKQLELDLGKLAAESGLSVAEILAELKNIKGGK